VFLLPIRKWVAIGNPSQPEATKDGKTYNPKTASCNGSVGRFTNERVKTPTAAQRLTDVLQAWSAGDSQAATDLAQLVYPELHKIAQCCLYKERPGHTLQPTALVNEAFLRLVRLRDIRWEDRTHFFAVSARFMRRILVEHARRRPRAVRVELTEDALVSGVLDPDLVALDEAISALAQADSRRAQVVELRFFGGCTAEETGAVLGISTPSVHRDWSLAKAWLIRHMRHHGTTSLVKDQLPVQRCGGSGCRRPS
jgi:RNA polymerase sigma factor (TIGR02999 family)